MAATPRRILIFALAALGLSLAFAPFPFRFLAFVGLTPLFRLTDSQRQEATDRGPRVFLWAWLFGGLAAAFHFWWLWFLVVPVEPVTRFLLNIGVVLLFAYLGLYTAVFAGIVRRLGLWSAPLVWPLLEYVKNLGQIAFPWDLLGYSMTPWTLFIQPASLGGVYLVSAWVVLVNLLVYRLLFPEPRLSPLRSRTATPPAGGRKSVRIRVAYAAALAAAFILPVGFGSLRARPVRAWLNVSIVQPNISPLDKGDIASREHIYSDLVRLIREAGSYYPDLIICPETATLFDVTDPSNYISRALRSLVDSLQTKVFTGTPLRDRIRGTWHNGAVLLVPGEDSVRQRYYKIRLVPFSEKIPYSDEVPLIRRLVGTSDMGNWDRGRDFTVFTLTADDSSSRDYATAPPHFPVPIPHYLSDTRRFSCLICFEAIFPDLCREFVRRGAQMLVVVTNDGWFGRIIGAQQHAELAVMRAVEQGVPMVRSANNGISLIVDPYGRIRRHTDLFTQTVITDSVPEPLPPTHYRRYGDWFIVACLIAVAALLVVHASRRANARSKPATDS